jgi:hypothetical protein
MTKTCYWCGIELISDNKNIVTLDNGKAVDCCTFHSNEYVAGRID